MKNNVILGWTIGHVTVLKAFPDQSHVSMRFSKAPVVDISVVTNIVEQLGVSRNSVVWLNYSSPPVLTSRVYC